MLSQRSYIDINGKLAIPIKIRKQLNLKPGDEVSLKCYDHELRVVTFQVPLEKARNTIAKYTNRSLVGELKAMRIEDANKE